MQAIRTKYHGPTDTRGSVITAKAEAGSITIPYPHDQGDGEPAHREAAVALVRKLGWATGRVDWRGVEEPQLIGGSLPDGSYVFTMLTEDRLADMLVGPTSGAKARELAARIMGAWDYENDVHKVTGRGPDHRTGSERP